ncbi:DASH family cryptochrome [Rhabdobacter roseus]|uniref:Cryptochrome DASH n=1 Tax=Rhabdobacter roseus TaxID=1655419 RepID=A0A840TDZ4_9BACT|nr:DASH family cryptochrome [Rhabdobacter roseus]MBB5282346.1 deoxyribodipyrimidine photo-lyase [Rhabdobacter roseus]
MTKRIIYWFRNDLRLYDNEGFWQATQQADEVIPVFVFDPRAFENGYLGFRRIGARRARFMVESVQQLRENIRAKGGELLVRIGEPEKIVADLAQAYDATAVYTSKEIAQEETDVESSLSKRLKMINVDIKLVWMATLYHPRDLPFSFAKLPQVFTDFRKIVEASAQVRPCLPTPDAIRLPANYEAGPLPTLTDLCYEENELPDPEGTPAGVLRFEGGEQAGQARLQQYFWERDQLRHYKETRNDLLGADYSSKLSAWLSLGCISPRYIYEEVKRYEKERVANDSTYWLVFELLWRDYFHFVMLRYGTRLFKPSGIRHNMDLRWENDRVLFDQWASGQTGVPFVDANMRELNATGYLSNRGRQNVASFLAKDLRLNWTWGAAYFESQLIDYDVCSNWGNWNYLAGVGNDPRANRYFNMYIQATRYDEQGTYVKYWLPQLAQVPAERVHRVWQLSTSEQQAYGLRLGTDYPLPIINTNSWLEEPADR